VKLQQELEQLTPIPDDELEIAADVLANFADHWDAAGDDRKRQKELLQLIVARVWVRDAKVVALSLRPNYHVTVGLDSEKPTELSVGLPESNLVHNRERRASAARWVHPLGAKRPTLSPDSSPEISPSVGRVILWKHTHTKFGMHQQTPLWGYLFHFASRSTEARRDYGFKHVPLVPPHSYAS
jgi:hypothetical protein